MKQGTQTDYRLLDHYKRRHVATLPDRILEALARLAEGLGGARPGIFNPAAGAFAPLVKRIFSRDPLSDAD